MTAIAISAVALATASIGAQAAAQTPTKMASPIPPAGPATAAPGALAHTPPNATSADPSVNTQPEPNEIIVTAQHRVENAQNVPISVSAINGEALNRASITSIQDLSGSVPSLVVSKSVSYGLAPISIRGLGGPAGGGSLLTDQPVAVYIDGVYVPALGQSVSDFLDLDSVQVLRGPQGTLYGRNSTAGALLLTSKRPSKTLGGEAHVSYGSFNEFRASGAINLPIVPELLAIRVALGRSSGGDWAHNSVDGRKFGGGSSSSGRVSLRFTPNRNVTVDLIADHSTGKSRPATVPLATVTRAFAGPTLGQQYSGNPYLRRADYAALLDSRRVQIVADQFTRTKSTDLTLLADWRLGGVTLTSITGWRKFEVSGSQDGSPFTVPAAVIGSNNTDQHQKSFSQEVRLASTGAGPFRWTIGAFYFHQNTDAFINILNYQAGPPVVTRFAPGPVFAGAPTGTTAAFSARQKVDSYAGFVDASYDFSEQFSVTAGVRVSRDKKRAIISNVVRTITPSLIGGGPVLVNASCPTATVSCETAFNNVSPRLVLNFKPAPNHLLYASYSKGFNSGGFNNFGNVANPTDPTNPLENSSEKITSYELGSKNEFFDRMLRLNLSLFQTDYKDLHIRQAVLTGGVSIVNVPSARIRGIELESVLRPTRNLTITANGSYLDGKIIEGRLATLASNVGSIRFGNQVVPIIENVAGNRLTRAPRWQGYASANYSQPVSFGSVNLTGTLRYQSKTYFSETNQDVSQYVGEAWREFDLRASLSGPENRWEVAVLGRNVFDNRHISQIVPFNGFPTATLNTPATWSVSGTVRF